MISWNEYLSSFVKEFRREFEKLFNLPPFKTYIEEAVEHSDRFYPFPNVRAFLTPCQISVFTFEDPGTIVLWKVTNNMKQSDMKFSSEEAPKASTTFLKTITPHWRMFPMAFSVESEVGKIWVEYDLTDDINLFKFPIDVRGIDVGDLITSFLGLVSRDYVYGRIETATEVLRDTVAEIVDAALKEKLLNVSKEIELSMARIRSLDTTVTGLRQLVRSTGEFRDVLSLLDTIDELRKKAVNKTLLDEKIRRLEEKIDQGLEALNKRIDDIGKIKIWSKRTIIDIILAGIAIASTIIAALLASGTLHS